jgi:group I intron endonuclease
MAKAKGISDSDNQCVYLLNRLVGEPKAYVGSTFNYKRRFAAYKNNSGKAYIEKVINKHGWNSFQKIIINVKVDSEKELRLWEGFYISLFGTYKDNNPDFGMNIVQYPTLAISTDPLVSKKISESMKGKVLSEETKNKIKLNTKGINKGVKRPYLSERNKIIKPALGRTGSKHPLSKKILYVPDDIIFESIKDLADYLGITRPAARSRIKYNPKIYKFL